MILPRRSVSDAMKAENSPGVVALAAGSAPWSTICLALEMVKAMAPTFGGEQFWSDEFIYQGWRIQLNALTGLYRLLDPRDIRRAWGTYELCRAAFDDVKRREMLPPLDGRAVVTLHGLIRSRDHMEGIGRFLEARAWLDRRLRHVVRLRPFERLRHVQGLRLLRRRLAVQRGFSSRHPASDMITLAKSTGRAMGRSHAAWGLGRPPGFPVAFHPAAGSSW
jgi:hypothetical protein